MSEPVGPVHIVLVGLMGSGKTTLGGRLARRLDRRFVDADDELEARTGRSVADWFERDGEDGFRRAEADLLVDLLADDTPSVIGSGGGVVVTESNRRLLRGERARVLYLHGSPAFLTSRTPERPHRPLLAGTDPLELFTEHHRVRDPWYREVADAVIEIGPDAEEPEPLLDRLLSAAVGHDRPDTRGDAR